MVPYCSCCLYLYSCSAVVLVAYFVNFRWLNDRLFERELFILFIASDCRQFMYLVFSLLVLGAGYGIRL